MKAWEIPNCEPAKVSIAKGALPVAQHLVYVMPASEFPAALPAIFKPHFASKALVEDVTKNSSTWIYAPEDPPTAFVRCLVYVLKSDKRVDARTAGSKVLEAVLGKGAKKATVWFAESIAEAQVTAFLNGYMLTNYDFSKRKDPARKVVDEVQIYLTAAQEKWQPVLECETIVVSAAIHARNYANQPGSVATPEWMQHEAEKVAAASGGKITLECIIGQELADKGLNCLHAVGKGATSPPRLVALHYKGNPASEATPFAFVGKGVTFDTGGLNLKGTGNIELMHLDKSGACAVLSAIRTLAELKVPVNVVGCMVLAENSIDNLSYKPSDVLTSYNGQTIVIDNTDAEGRLCLIDGMSYMQRKYKPQVLLDLATLTGACMVALGQDRSGLFYNDEALADQVRAAGEKVFEKHWKMPSGEEYLEQDKASNADLSNMGDGTFGGACKAASFLLAVVEPEVKWVHLDIAGPCLSKGAKGPVCKGGTGFGAQTLVSFLMNMH
jgi:leucyl aminopeptidase